MSKNYWLLKSEPSAWSWDDQVKSKVDMWDGVRNYQARNNLMKMKKNDLCFFYHSVSEKSIVGIVEVVKEHYPDPTDKKNKFVVIFFVLGLDFSGAVSAAFLCGFAWVPPFRLGDFSIDWFSILIVSEY